MGKIQFNTIGLDKKPKDCHVVVAMSGGVDSSTVAGMMKQEGYNVTGITLKLYDDGKMSSPRNNRQCCAGQDIMDAKRVSEKLNIDHKILYYQNKFKKDVIDNFVDGYIKGETPIPCVQCNQTVKFRDLYSYAKELKADALITGHYVDRLKVNGKAFMYRAKDFQRDQSYFLFNTTQEQLNFLRFPLGKLTKTETRKIASKLNLNVANKPDSQDICFVPNGDYASVIKKFKPSSFKKGDIVDLKGNKVGEHQGIINFTIGQRKRIKVAGEEPFYVLKINAQKNQIIIGPKDALGVDKIFLRELNLFEDLSKCSDVFVKVRSTGKFLKTKTITQSQNATVHLQSNETGVSPGQACVFYKKDKFGDKVLGGGWISGASN
jgi:tRNA-specific 2-thiouridylase